MTRVFVWLVAILLFVGIFVFAASYLADEPLRRKLEAEMNNRLKGYTPAGSREKSISTTLRGPCRRNLCAAKKHASQRSGYGNSHLGRHRVAADKYLANDLKFDSKRFL
jgi:hypothetical protein